MSSRPSRLGLLVALAALLTGVGCHRTAQVVRGPQSCSEARRVDDAFEGSQRGNVYRLGSVFRTHGSVGIMQQGSGAVDFRLEWVFYGLMNDPIPAGTPIDVALGDGQTFSLMTAADAPPVLKSQTSRTEWSLFAPLTPTQLQSLANGQVRALRIRVSNMPQEIQIPHPVAVRLQTLAICLNGNFPNAS